MQVDELRRKKEEKKKATRVKEDDDEDDEDDEDYDQYDDGLIYKKRKCHDCGKATFSYRCQECWCKRAKRFGIEDFPIEEFGSIEGGI